MPKKIAITSYATGQYLSTVPNMFKRLIPCIRKALKKGNKVAFILVTDWDSKTREETALIENYKLHDFGNQFTTNVVYVKEEFKDNKPYKNDAQLLIARLQNTAFDIARQWGADLCWSVEADILVPHNALAISRQMLEFDDGYYDVAMITYPSQGGGGFLGGRGTPQNPIAEDWLPEERDIPEDLEKELKASDEEEAQFIKDKKPPTEEWIEKHKELVDKVKQCPPKKNVFAANAERWRRRGWLEQAYPAIGKGAIVPTDWVGLGCTLLSKKALDTAFFEGYAGYGTQDLFLCWHRWYPEDLKACVITHKACEHIVRDRKEEDQQDFHKQIHCHPFYEKEGEYAGHIRLRHNPWYAMVPGEKFDESNNGRLSIPKTVKEDPDDVS